MAVWVIRVLEKHVQQIAMLYVCLILVIVPGDISTQTEMMLTAPLSRCQPYPLAQSRMVRAGLWLDASLILVESPVWHTQMRSVDLIIVVNVQPFIFQMAIGLIAVCNNVYALGKSVNTRSNLAACPGGDKPQLCDPKVCQSKGCPAFPNALCSANPCNSCELEFFVNGRKIRDVDCIKQREFKINILCRWCF